MPASDYAVITPVRNEAEDVSRLARSLVGQTVTPTVWVVVDTGSTDATADVMAELAGEHAWIRFIDSDPNAGSTSPSSSRAAPIVAGFHSGIRAIGGPTELVAKVDADISFDSDYFERLIQAFDEDPTLGIASGTCFELTEGEWRQRFVTGSSVWGAARAYRRSCLDQVLPLEQRMGWDGIDIVKANVCGWRTKTMLDLPFYHHRREAIRERSRWHAWSVQGETNHYMGYRPSYVLARTIFQMRRDPAAFGMLWSFVASSVMRRPTCPDTRVRAYVRRMQRLRALPTRRREAVGRRA